jgi:hypothetical protein
MKIAIVSILLSLGLIDLPTEGTCYLSKLAKEEGPSSEIYEVVKVRSVSRERIFTFYTFPNSEKFKGKWAYLIYLEANYIDTNRFVADYSKVECPY